MNSFKVKFSALVFGQMLISVSLPISMTDFKLLPRVFLRCEKASRVVLLSAVGSILSGLLDFLIGLIRTTVDCTFGSGVKALGGTLKRCVTLQ